MDYPGERLEVMLQYKPQSMIQKLIYSLNGQEAYLMPCYTESQIFSAWVQIHSTVNYRLGNPGDLLNSVFGH